MSCVRSSHVCYVRSVRHLHPKHNTFLVQLKFSSYYAPLNIFPTLGKTSAKYSVFTWCNRNSVQKSEPYGWESVGRNLLTFACQHWRWLQWSTRFALALHGVNDLTFSLMKWTSIASSTFHIGADIGIFVMALGTFRLQGHSMDSIPSEMRK